MSQAVSLPEAKLLLKEDDELIKEVFDYWSRKRKNSKANSLIPNVKQERRDGSSTSDPYVAFRRRTEKMQTRKVGSLAHTGTSFSLVFKYIIDSMLELQPKENQVNIIPPC